MAKKSEPIERKMYCKDCNSIEVHGIIQVGKFLYDQKIYVKFQHVCTRCLEKNDYMEKPTPVYETDIKENEFNALIYADIFD